MSTFIEDLSEKTALVDNDLGVIADSAASNQNKKVKLSSLWNWIKSKCTNNTNANTIPVRDGNGNLTASEFLGNISSLSVAEPGYLLGNISKIASHGYDVLRADRTAFMPSKNIIIEKSTDAGITWTDAEFTDLQKALLFTGARPNITIPLKNGVRNTDCMIRITITAMNYNVPANTPETSKYSYWNSSNIISTERCCSIDEMWLWMNTNSDKVYLKIEVATGASPNTWINKREAFLAGWTGGNYVKLFGDIFGGATSHTGNYWNYRFTFRTATPSLTFDNSQLSTSYTTSNQAILHIKTSGKNCWASPNSLMFRDHLYNLDELQNALFPAKISGTQFISTIPQGTAPFQVASSTLVENLNAKKWDSHDFSQYLNQAVRTTDQPYFQQITLAYPADNDYEAVRGDKEIVISTSSANNALLIHGLTERTRKLSQSLGFIFSLVQGDIELGQNTNGMNIQNGIAKVLGEDNVKIDLPQRIDQDSNFKAQTITSGHSDSNNSFGSIAHGDEAYIRNMAELSMCSGNDEFNNNFGSGFLKANTNNIHMEGAIILPNDDFIDFEIIPKLKDLSNELKSYIDFNYNMFEYFKQISYELNIVLDLFNGTGLFDTCTLNFNGMIVRDNANQIKHLYKQSNSFSSNFLSDILSGSIFRDVALQLDFGTTPINFRLYPKLRVNSVNLTAFDWFETEHTSLTPLGDGASCVVSSWKFEFNSLSSSEKFVIMSKNK